MGSSQEPGRLGLASHLPTTAVRFARDPHPSAVVVLRPVVVLPHLLIHPMGFLRVYYHTLSLSRRAFLHCRDSLMTPPSGPLVALLGTFLLVMLLTPGALRSKPQRKEEKNGWKGLAAHPRALSLAVLIASLAPLFGFTAIALGLVGYVTTLFKLSAVLTILWAWWFLGEGHIKSRLLGASVMILGGLLVAT